MPEGGKAAAVDTIEWFPFCRHTHRHLCPHTIPQREYLFITSCLCTSYVACGVCMERNRLYMAAWMCVSVCVKGGNVRQEAASLSLQQGASSYCKQTHPHTLTHTRFWLWLVSHMADNIRRVTLGYCEDRYRCHLIEKRKRGGMALLSVSCRNPVCQPLVIWGFSNSLTTHCILCSCWVEGYHSILWAE